MKLAAARVEESQALARMHAGAFADPWSAEDLASLLASPGVTGRALWSTNEIIGLCLIRVIAREAEVISLAIASGHRRQGLATVLLEAARSEASARGAERMFLEVSEANAAALGLYRKSGFATAGRRKAYYGPACDALVLRLDLNS